MRIESTTSTPDRNEISVRARLIDTAQQFEAMLLQQMLKPIQDSENSWDTKDKDHSADTLSSFGTEAVAKAISKRGGFGIARRVISQVTQERSVELEKIHLGTKV